MFVAAVVFGGLVNYAALLAVMVLLAFCFPMAVHLGESLGLSAGTAAVALWSLLVFALAFTFVRWQVARERQRAAQLEQGRMQVLERPSDSAAYFVGGQHLALLLLQRGRRREAAELIDRYAQLGGAREAEILMLREALSSASRWQFRRKVPARPAVPVRELRAAKQQQQPLVQGREHGHGRDQGAQSPAGGSKL